MQDVDLYLKLNSDIYNNDNKKIVFTLSFLSDGPAKIWKESFLTEKLKDRTYKLGTITDFIKDLQVAFAPTDAGGSSKAALQSLKQTGIANEYVSQFQVLTGRFGMTEDIPLIEYFMEGVKPTILDNIYVLEKVPTTIARWYTKATQIDNQWHRSQEIEARNKGTMPPKPNELTPHYTNNPNPNAMDIDQMTTKEQTDHMKKGLCFGCHQPGHIRRNCPNRMKKNDPAKTLNIKKNRRTAYAIIQSLYNELDEGEKAVIIQKMENEGF